MTQKVPKPHSILISGAQDRFRLLQLDSTSRRVGCGLHHRHDFKCAIGAASLYLSSLAVPPPASRSRGEVGHCAGLGEVAAGAEIGSDAGGGTANQYVGLPNAWTATDAGTRLRF